MHAALQINPYYGKTSQDGLNAHFDAALAEGPAIIYNVPARTGQDIPDSVVLRLASHPNFMGVKECTGNARIEVRCLHWSMRLSLQSHLHMFSEAMFSDSTPSRLKTALTVHIV